MSRPSTNNHVVPDPIVSTGDAVPLLELDTEEDQNEFDDLCETYLTKRKRSTETPSGMFLRPNMKPPRIQNQDYVFVQIRNKLNEASNDSEKLYLLRQLKRFEVYGTVPDWTRRQEEGVSELIDLTADEPEIIDVDSSELDLQTIRPEVPTSHPGIKQLRIQRTDPPVTSNKKDNDKAQPDPTPEEEDDDDENFGRTNDGVTEDPPIPSNKNNSSESNKARATSAEDGGDSSPPHTPTMTTTSKNNSSESEDHTPEEEEEDENFPGGSYVGVIEDPPVLPNKNNSGESNKARTTSAEDGGDSSPPHTSTTTTTTKNKSSHVDEAVMDRSKTLLRLQSLLDLRKKNKAPQHELDEIRTKIKEMENESGWTIHPTNRDHPNSIHSMDDIELPLRTEDPVADITGHIPLRHGVIKFSRRRGNNCVPDSVSMAIGLPYHLLVSDLQDAWNKEKRNRGKEIIKSVSLAATALCGMDEARFILTNESKSNRKRKGKKKLQESERVDSFHKLFQQKQGIYVVSVLLRVPGKGLQGHCIAFNSEASILLDGNCLFAIKITEDDRALSANVLNKRLKEDFDYVDFRSAHLVKVKKKDVENGLVPHHVKSVSF